MKKTVLFGDSLTAGRIGIAYRRYIPLSTEVHGIEGNTWAEVMQRVHRYLKAKKPSGQTTIIIQGGANDLLLPYMAEHYLAWKLAVGSQGVSGTSVDVEDQEYRETILRELKLATHTYPHTDFLLCSIPILGERLDSGLNNRMRLRNESMREVTDSFKRVLWCDITTPLEKLVREKNGNSEYLPEKPEKLGEDVAYIGNDEKKAASISAERKLIVTIDGIHPNAAGAQTIAAAISAVLP